MPTEDDFVYIVFLRSAENLEAFALLLSQFQDIQEEQRLTTLIKASDIVYVDGEPVLTEDGLYDVADQYELIKVTKEGYEEHSEDYAQYTYDLYYFEEKDSMTSTYWNVKPPSEII